jgi:opacity protein-like surface antigen
MSNRFFSIFALSAFFMLKAITGFSQVAPAATSGGSSIPLVVGGGISDFDLDYGQGRRMEGVSAWVDWNFNHMPRVLRGIGIEAEGHDINLNRPSSLTRMRQDTGLGGVTYHFVHSGNIDPYIKMLGGIGSIDFPSKNPHYTHDTFEVLAPGGGVEYRVWGQVWVRGDYEYQLWEHTFGPHNLTPQGFTFGASYHFQRPYRH